MLLRVPLLARQTDVSDTIPGRGEFPAARATLTASLRQKLAALSQAGRTLR